jgi:hypothetical protein
MNTSRQEKDIEFAASTLETQTNTTFADQKVMQETRGQQAQLPPPPNTIPDMKWFASQQLEKPIILRQDTWAIGDVPGDVIATIDFPSIYSLMPPNLHTQTLGMYSYYRGNPVFRFQLNGTKFHLGQLVAVWMPLRTSAYSSSIVTSMTGYPHVQLSASGNDPVELKIPFVHPQNYITTNTANTCDLGQLRIVVLNQLRSAASASSDLSITTTIHWDEPEVHVPVYLHAITTNMAETAPEPTGLFDKLFDVTNNATATISHLLTGNIRGVLSSGGKTLTGVSTMDKPAYVGVPQKTISPIGNLSHGKGVDVSQRMGLDAGATVPKVLDAFGGTDEEMTMKHVITTPMMVKTINWPDSKNQGDLLASWPVSPLLSNDVSLAGLTFIAYVAQVFSYWRGSIKYRFDFITTSFHTGRLMVVFQPNGQGQTAPTFTQAMSLPNTIIDMQKTSRVTVEVPFTSATPFKMCLAGEDNINSYTGSVYVFVLNDLVHPSNVAADIDINIYVSAGDDFEFAVPRNLILTLPITEEETPEPTALFDNVQEGLSSKSETTILLATGGVHNYENNFGEDYSLFDVAKRYSEILSYPEAGTSNTPLGSLDIPITPMFSRGGDVGVVHPTLLSYITQLYACWFGSLRYKVLTENDRTKQCTLKVVAYPNMGNHVASSSPILSGYPQVTTSTAQDNSIEFEVCPYTYYNFALTNHPDHEFPRDDMGAIRIQASDNETNYHLYHAAGDDFQAFYMVAPPFYNFQRIVSLAIA